MRDKNVFSFKRAMPRMSWSTANLFNLYTRTAVAPTLPGPRQNITFNQPSVSSSLFKQRWASKAVVRAYHGDYIPEKIFKRWYLPTTLPDVRPTKVTRHNAAEEEYAKRKRKEKEYEDHEGKHGLAPVLSLMFSELERRLDTLVFRACLAPSIYDARRLIVHGNVMINGRKESFPGTRLAPGDMVSVLPSAVKHLAIPPPHGKRDHIFVNSNNEPGKPTRFHLPLYASPHLFIPAYIEPQFTTCSFIYVRHPTARPGYSELPSPYDADGEVLRFAWEWYAARRSRVRSVQKASKGPKDRLRDLTQEVTEERERMRLWKQNELKTRLLKAKALAKRRR